MKQFKLRFSFPILYKVQQSGKSLPALLLAFAIFPSFLFHCGKSQSFEIIPEPVVDQVSVHSDEICLESFLWVFDKNPCIFVKGEKNNTSLKKDYLLIYRLSSFDVEFPLGVSVEVDGNYHNLVKVTTDYGSTMELVSSISESSIPGILKAKKIRISYTNRSETRNYTLTNSQVQEFQSAIKQIQEMLKKEPRLKIQK